MVRFVALVLLFSALPFSSGAATLRADNTLAVSELPLGNAYLAGSEVRVSAPVSGDLIAAAGTMQVSAPVSGDVLVASGAIDFSAPIAGDVRAAAGRAYISSEVGGELAIFAGHLTVSGKVNEVRAAGGAIELTSGASGPVTIYGANVVLGGEFAGNVRVVSSDQITLSEGTVIKGAFEYNAPQEALIPATAVIEGGAHYIGSASFLPTTEEAKTFALAGVGIFFLVRLVAAMLAAGLVIGLFPEFARRVTHESIGRSLRRFLLLGLLGFAVLVATPVLIILLLASFVGIGIAALIGAVYVLLLLLAYLYAGVLVGSVFAQLILKRPGVSWRSAAFGMLVLYLLGLLPGFGLFVSFVLSAVALGAIISISYRFAFGRAEIE